MQEVVVVVAVVADGGDTPPPPQQQQGQKIVVAAHIDLELVHRPYPLDNSPGWMKSWDYGFYSYFSSSNELAKIAFRKNWVHIRAWRVYGHRFP